MPAPGPQKPPDRETQIASMREAEKAALEELRRDPLGVTNVAPGGQDEAELVAMLAGSTAQEMKRNKFGDNTASAVAAPILDPRDVVSKFVKQTPGGVITPGGAPIRNSAAVPIIPGRAIPPVQPPKDPNDPQLELDLFRSMNMTDVYNKISDIESRLVRIEEVQNKVLKFMEAIQNA